MSNEPSREQRLRTALVAVIDEVMTLQSGEDASRSRDFGRGVAYAAGRLSDVIKTHLESM